MAAPSAGNPAFIADPSQTRPNLADGIMWGGREPPRNTSRPDRNFVARTAPRTSPVSRRPGRCHPGWPPLLQPYLPYEAGPPPIALGGSTLVLLCPHRSIIWSVPWIVVVNWENGRLTSLDRRPGYGDAPGLEPRQLVNPQDPGPRPEGGGKGHDTEAVRVLPGKLSTHL